MTRHKVITVVWTIVGITIIEQLGFYIVNQNKLPSLTAHVDRSTHMDCSPDITCKYPEEVDLRIIVMTFNRPDSLKKTLQSLNDLKLDGDTGSLEIWIDRKLKAEKNGSGPKDTIDTDTVETALTFTWLNGQTRVHIHKTHVGIYGQWIDTWRPRRRSKELALFLEDDISVSPYAYRWLKAVHQKYGSRNDIAGYTLQSEEVHMASNGRPINRPRNDTVFLYKLLGSWGYAPHPKSWMEFQDWYHRVRNNTRFQPYVPKAALVTRWYKTFEMANKQNTMWTIWHVYYCNKFNMFSVYSNLNAVTKRSEILLAANRKEPGLHFPSKLPEHTDKLLHVWSDNYVTLPDHPQLYDFDGSRFKTD